MPKAEAAAGLSPPISRANLGFVYVDQEDVVAIFHTACGLLLWKTWRPQ